MGTSSSRSIAPYDVRRTRLCQQLARANNNLWEWYMLVKKGRSVLAQKLKKLLRTLSQRMQKSLHALNIRGFLKRRRGLKSGWQKMKLN